MEVLLCGFGTRYLSVLFRFSEWGLIAEINAQNLGHPSGRATNLLPNSAVIDQSVPGSNAGSARVPDSYGKIPLSFEVNQGQTDGRVRFVTRGSGYDMYLTSSEVLLSLHRIHGSMPQKSGLESPMRWRMELAAMAKNVDSATVRMRLIGSNPDAQAVGVDPLPGKVNYLIGKDPREWHTDVPTYAKVRLN